MLFDILCHIVLCKYLAVCLFGGMTRKDSPGGREYAAKTRANGQKLRDVCRGRVAFLEMALITACFQNYRGPA
jgi:hypothetical protein